MLANQTLYNVCSFSYVSHSITKSLQLYKMPHDTMLLPSFS